MSREDPEGFARFMTEFPAGELMDPMEVAEVLAFLLSDQARGINGANIPVDRGQNAPERRRLLTPPRSHRSRAGEQVASGHVTEPRGGAL